MYMTPHQRIAINLPEPVARWLTTQAATHFLDLADHIRALLVQLYRNAQGMSAPVPDAGRVTAPNLALVVPAAATPGTPGTPGTPAATITSTAPTASIALPAPNSAEPVVPGEAPTQSGYRGVYPYGKRWQAVMTVNRKRVRLGAYDSPVDAAKAYDLAVRANGGETTNRQLNFGEPTIPPVLQPYIDRLARGEAMSRGDFAEFARASQIYDAGQAGGGPVDFTGMSVPLVVDEPPRRLRVREDAMIVIPAMQVDAATEADADDGT